MWKMHQLEKHLKRHQNYQIPPKTQLPPYKRADLPPPHPTSSPPSLPQPLKDTLEHMHLEPYLVHCPKYTHPKCFKIHVYRVCQSSDKPVHL